MPAGGISGGQGFEVIWQDGPVSEPGSQPGAFVEDLLEAVRDRLQFYQRAAGGKYACEENMLAIEKISEALGALDARTRRREARGVEGTDEP